MSALAGDVCGRTNVDNSDNFVNSANSANYLTLLIWLSLQCNDNMNIFEFNFEEMKTITKYDMIMKKKSIVTRDDAATCGGECS